MTRRAHTDQLFVTFLVSMLSYLSGIAPCGGQADLSAHFAKNETHPKWTFLGSDRKRCYYEISKGTSGSSLAICSRPTGFEIKQNAAQLQAAVHMRRMALLER
jgi:hypothetical protein